MNYRRLVLALFAGLVMTQASAQEQPDLDRLDEKLNRHLEKKMPGWTHSRGEPIQGSKGVLIQVWSCPNRRIKIAVSSMKSAEEARQAMQSFARDVKEARFLEGFGDEAYVWGFEGSDLVVRRGRFVIYLNAGANVTADADARTLTRAERHARQQAEVRRIIRDFAKHLVATVDLP